MAQKPGTQKSALQKPALQKKTAQEKFAKDVVQMAVALPQPDLQDRLRVLYSAITVEQRLAPSAAQKFAAEGAHIEAQLVAGGQKPDVSIFGTGAVSCSAAEQFVEWLSPASVSLAEDSLLGALTSCPEKLEARERSRAEAALEQNVLAPRLMLALIERAGPANEWSEREFAAMFRSLPSEANAFHSEAPNFAAMYDAVSAAMPKDVTRDAGLHLLAWLGKLDASGERNLAVNISTAAMKKALGQKAYQEALQSDAVAQSVAATAGQPGEITPPEEDSVSVMKAAQQEQQSAAAGQFDEMKDMPAPHRARQAAAEGFAAGTSGDRELARRYFDVAYSALNEVWPGGAPEKDAPAVVEEVAEAAANVNPVDALQRSQGLQDPTAAAISMLAVARVVEAQP